MRPPQAGRLPVRSPTSKGDIGRSGVAAALARPVSLAARRGIPAVERVGAGAHGQESARWFRLAGDSALEGDCECVQGWFRALSLSNTSRTRRGQGYLTSANGSTRHLGARRDRLGRFTSTRTPGARRRVGLRAHPIRCRRPSDPPPSRTEILRGWNARILGGCFL